MAIQKFREPHETLVRFENGLPVALHHIVKTGYSDGGEVDLDSVKLLPAEAQELATFKDSEIFGEIAAGALTQVGNLTAEIEALNAKLTQVREEADAAIRQAEADADAAISEANGKVDAMREALTQAAQVTAAGLQ